MLALLLLVVAAAPQVPADLAACKFVEDSVFVFEDCDSCLKVKAITFDASPRYEVRTLSYGMGRDGTFTETFWLSDAKDCTAVGLMIEGGGGSPASMTSFVSSKEGRTANAAEQAQLLRLTGFAAADPNDARDQLAHVEKAPRWLPGAPKAQRNSYRPVRREPDEGACPCYETFAGTAFKKQQTVTLGAAKLHLYATSARNQSWAWALESHGKTAWGQLGVRLSVKPGAANGRHFVLETVSHDEVPRQTVLIDSETGAQVIRGNTVSDEPLGNP